jgi:uncharacterized protein with von Willebrand factor type A (vWA) domain
MDFQSLVTIIGGVVGLVGGLAGILSWHNQRKQNAILQGQLDVMQEQLQTVKRQEGTTTEWDSKFDEDADALTKISPGSVQTGQATVLKAYEAIFKSEDLRRRIEGYLGRRTHFLHKFQPAALTREQLQNPVVQRTIQEVLESVAKFKAEHTDFARALRLLPPK